MIFRLVLPDVVEASYFDRRQAAVLKVNRQFYEEASTIMYGELKFKAVVCSTSVKLFGMHWSREPFTIATRNLADLARQTGIQRIRHLEVQVHFGEVRGKFKGIGTSGVLHEDYELYQARDLVRKLVEVVVTQPFQPGSLALKQLKVKPAPSYKQQWRSDEITAATFFVLEPFLALGPIEDVSLPAPLRPMAHSWRYTTAAAAIDEIYKDEEYHRLRKQWLRSFKGQSSSLNVVCEPCEATAAIKLAYGKIEDFAELIYNQDSAQFTGGSLLSGCPGQIYCILTLLANYQQAYRRRSMGGRHRHSKVSNESCTSPELAWKMAISSSFDKYMKPS